MATVYSLFAVIGLTVIDQLIKWIVTLTIYINGEVALIPEVLIFKYRENTGAAFSIFEGNTGLLSIFTGIILLAGIVVIVKRLLKDPFLPNNCSFL